MEELTGFLRSVVCIDYPEDAEEEKEQGGEISVAEGKGREGGRTRRRRRR